MHEMVYDDTRWVQRLRKMDCWNEVEARRRAESSRADAYNVTSPPARRKSTNPSITINGLDRPPSSSKLLDTTQSTANGTTPERRKSSLKSAYASDGFDPVPVTSPTTTKPANVEKDDPSLTVLQHVRSIRGQARQEYGKVFQVLAPFYHDAVEAERPMKCKVFMSYTSPEQQAQMLAQVRTFAKSDLSPGAYARSQKLGEVISIFDTAALLEFRKGYEDHDIDGNMRKYAHVLHTLNGGQSSIELYIHHNHLILERARLGSPGDCIDYSSGHGQISLERTQQFFNRLQIAFTEEQAIIERAFPFPSLVLPKFLEQMGKAVLSPYLTSLFDEAHSRGLESYLRTVSGTFAQTQNFLSDISPSESSSEEFVHAKRRVASDVFEPHLDLYLAEELAFFKQTAEAEVERWDQALSEQAASTETFLMSNINRQADKKDFMSSFKKVVMMPVNILPSFPTLSGNKSTAKALVNGDSTKLEKRNSSRSSSPTPGSMNPVTSTPMRSLTPLPVEAPTTELAAKVALMTSKLENIRSLFSIEVALNLVHHAKSSLERAAQFIELPGPPGQAARRQCSAIYVSLLQILGTRHVKAGFDKAVDHLSNYNPRQAAATTNLSSSSSPTDSTGQEISRVAPLTTFLELTNVGDLIQQMLDVFFESQLIAHGVVQARDDFLDPSIKEKKRFEQMLDERVAAGLGKGIDVLMEEVEFICATTQLPTDFNPTTADVDLGPTTTAKKVIELISSHTSMLHGSTDKTLLDVFSTELGLRLFGALTKHIKRQRISTTGAIALLSDLSAYASYIATFRNNDLNSYFTALREVGQIYLIEIDVDGHNAKKADAAAKEMAEVIADKGKYSGVFTVEEVLEFAERRGDWLSVKGRVERGMYGQGCVVI
jgi:recyclin-1